MSEQLCIPPHINDTAAGTAPKAAPLRQAVDGGLFIYVKEGRPMLVSDWLAAENAASDLLLRIPPAGEERYIPAS